jgi:hypothetical protein
VERGNITPPGQKNMFFLFFFCFLNEGILELEVDWRFMLIFCFLPPFFSFFFFLYFSFFVVLCVCMFFTKIYYFFL